MEIKTTPKQESKLPTLKREPAENIPKSQFQEKVITPTKLKNVKPEKTPKAKKSKLPEFLPDPMLEVSIASEKVQKAYLAEILK